MTTDRPDIAGGYRSEPDHAERRAQRTARAWRHDPDMERLLQLKEANPGRWDQLPSSTRLQAGYYASAKAAARQTGTDTNPPKDAA